MNFLIIYNSPLEANFSAFHTQIEKFEQFYRINNGTWGVYSDQDAQHIKSALSESMGIRDHLIVFKLTDQWAIANDIDLSDWLSTQETLD